MPTLRIIIPRLGVFVNPFACLGPFSRERLEIRLGHSYLQLAQAGIHRDQGFAKISQSTAASVAGTQAASWSSSGHRAAKYLLGHIILIVAAVPGVIEHSSAVGDTLKAPEP